MEQYFEQTVAKEATPIRRALYVICVLMIAALVIAAMLFAANAADLSAPKLKLSWPNLILALLALGAAGILFRRKDDLRVEYDYIYQDGAIEIAAVLNRRRRKRLLYLDVNRIQRVESAAVILARRDYKIHNWYAREGATCLCYLEGNVRHAARLDLNEAFIDRLRGGMSGAREKG